MLHYIDYTSMTQSNDVAEVTHDTTQHDIIGMHIMAMIFVSSCCVAE